MPLITAAEARQQIPGLTGTLEDSLLESLILAAGGAMAAYCGYPGTPATMESQTYTRFFDSAGGRDLVVDVWPVISVTSIYDDPTTDFVDSQYLVSSSDYQVVEGQKVRLKSTASHGAWYSGKGTIKVTFVAGYASIDATLKQACKFTVKHFYDLRQLQGKTSQNQGPVAIGLVDPTALPKETRQLLGPYRLPRAFL